MSMFALLSAIISQNELARNKSLMKEEFRKLDTDRDECLSQSEYRQLLNNCNIYMNDNGK